MKRGREYVNAAAEIAGGGFIVAGCYFVGRLLSGWTGGLLSGAVIGMLLLFFLLATGIVRKKRVERTARFLLNHLILFFIPALVGAVLIDVSGVLPSLADIVVISVVSTAVVMLSTGLFVEWREYRKNRLPGGNGKC